jgi:hypothetical protein
VVIKSTAPFQDYPGDFALEGLVFDLARQLGPFAD